MAQQFDSATFGMWVFLLTEIMFFGGMFGAYTIYRSMYPEAFASTSNYMNPLYRRAEHRGADRQQLDHGSGGAGRALGPAESPATHAAGLTMFFGACFLVIKGFEYHEHWVDMKVPLFGGHWNYSEAPQFAHQAQILFIFYFFMTGFHAVHMIVGLGIMTTIFTMARRGRFGPSYYTPVEVSGLYWHFVDIVWIFLFPLLYLIGHTRKIL